MVPMMHVLFNFSVDIVHCIQQGLVREARPHALLVRNLCFSYTPHVPGSEVLQGVSFKVPWGARVVLVGLNGAGKSTLLSILAGARMVPEGVVKVLGEDAFRGASARRKLVLISSEWTAAVSAMSSASAEELMTAAVEQVCEQERAEAKERGRRLAELLGVDSKWQVYALSEGQRRRLHLVIKLMPLYQIALLDEATTDLDIVARRNLLLFLRHDSAVRHATVIYCTHIFDGLEGWASHIALIQGHRLARLVNCLSIPELAPPPPHTHTSQTTQTTHPQLATSPSSSASLYEVVHRWLKASATCVLDAPTQSLCTPRTLLERDASSSSASSPAAVAVTHLSWGWGAGAAAPGQKNKKNEKRLVLRDLCCEVQGGRRVVVAGANGAGTTF